MTPEERARGDRFYFERDRARYRVTRALVRSVLSRYAPLVPEAWRFEPTSYGQPLIVNPQPEAQSLSFNLTHTSDLVVLAVTRGRALGVDTENTTRGAMLDVADRFFAPSECEHLRDLPAEAQATRFFELWTLKESYIKARGMGLSIGLGKFAFDLRTPGGVSLSTLPELQDPAERWALRHLWATPDHPVALCVERLGTQAFDVVARRVVPLRDESAMRLVAARSN
ncbi:MAG: 4'-phosphopantetheinyl transferase superfamily protein [Rhizobacter sp.]|nr:4'-phosphopantetheinyl transferase superfamily protein [Rhizobacter sp.]